MKSLFQLYREHQGKVTDKWSIYLSEYDRLFSIYRDQPVCMLEIGIQNGGSLEIWSKYFQNAQALVGCDINPDCARLTYDDLHIKVVVGDANTDVTEAEILSHSPHFDLIIDDGSHTSSDIVKSFARYFRHLNQGGIFVAEDLHCSYWKDFEGGLYYPYSSLAFFKRLADVVNHEHWGVEKERKQLLRGFSEQFLTEFDESDLAQIHSIEFLNSVCVVHKRRAQSNVLGERFIAGQNELVVSGLHGLHGHSLTQLQSSNPWATMISAPDEDWEKLSKAVSERDSQIAGLIQSASERDIQIASLIQSVSERDSQIARMAQEVQSLRNSTSWRVTKPARFIGHQIARGKHLVRVAPVALKMGGGAVATLKKARDLYRREGLAGVKRGIRIVLTGEGNAAVGSDGFDRNNYAEWVRRYDTIDDAKRAKLRGLCEGLISKPKISVVMPTYNPKPEWLIEAIESVRRQIYPNWELCIADDASPDPAIRPILQRYAREDERIKVVFREQNGHISAASNSALALATGEWVALLDHDDILAEHALLCLAEEAQQSPNIKLIYSDEDKLDLNGNRCQPFFKPGWSPHLACSQAYLGHLVAFNVESGKPHFDENAIGAQDYDLWLTLASKLRPEEIVHTCKILYHWRMHSQSTASNPESKSYADAAGLYAVNKFLDNHYPGLPVSAENGEHTFTYKLNFEIASDVLFSIIIPTKDKIELLTECVNSIINKSSWNNFEIIILDNNSEEKSTFEYFDYIQKLDSRVRVIPAKVDFNWSHLNNLGVQHAKGDIFVFLNNDTSVISPDWLERLGGYASLPDVGVVGALLLFEDGSIQHSGVVVGMGGWADHVYRAQRAKHSGSGPFVSPVLTRNVLAVTGACMAITKEKFDTLGGFDESFIICGSDVEICLRAIKAGLLNIMCAEVRLFHYESKTRSSFVPAVDYEQSILKYSPYRVERTDPYFNQNLSLNSTSPCFEDAPRDS